jgi:endonuclease/exonuclease/phosphatase (EEP) superfamily protein YafD
MKISHHSSHQQARKGVIIIAKPEHTIMEGSLRESDEPGHIAAAVYEVNKSRTVVIGVYGISENNDRSSADLIQEVSNLARELKHLYNTQHVIVAGDFNAVLSRRLERPPHQKNKNNGKAAHTTRTTQPHRSGQCC